MNGVFDLVAVKHESRVLMQWLAADPQRAARALPPTVLNVGNNGATFASTGGASQIEALFGNFTAASGFQVTDRTAMQVSTVYACLTKLSGAVLQLPICHYREGADGNREEMPKKRLWWLLNEQPDARWTSASWKEWIMRCVALRGDQFTEIVRTTPSSTEIASLLPHHPDCVNVRTVQDDAGALRLRYDVFDPYTGNAYGVDQDDMLHFAGFGFDGTRSLSVIQWAARQAVGNALAAADYSGRTIGQGALPQIALAYPNKMSPDQQQLLRDSFVATYGGTNSRKLPLILTEGANVKELSISPVDLQLLESRRFERDEICDAFGVPPVLLGSDAKTSSWGTGIEQITLGFVRWTIKPMLRRWQEELNRKLFRTAGQFVEFDLDELLAGDSKAQAEYYRAAIGGPGSGDGWMSVDEVRAAKRFKSLGGDSAVPFRAQRGTSTTPGKAAP